MPLFKGGTPDAYGPELQGLRNELRRNKGMLKCVMCHGQMSMDLEKIQEEKRQRIFREISAAGEQEKDIFEEFQKGAVCRKCKAILCESCSDMACIEVMESGGAPRCPLCNETIETLEHIID